MSSTTDRGGVDRRAGGRWAVDGLRVGVTAARRGDALCGALRDRGARVLWGPTLAADRRVGTERLVAETDALLGADPAWFVASTRAGMDRWFRVCRDTGRYAALRALLERSRLVARGSKAHGALRAEGLEPAFIPVRELDEEVACWLSPRVGPGDTVGLQLHGTGGAEPYAPLTDRGVELATVAPYRCTLPEDPSPARALITAVIGDGLDLVLFTSPPAARNLWHLAAGLGREVQLVAALRRGVGVAAIGPRTAEEVERLGGRVTLMPRRARTGELLREVARWASRDHRRAAQPPGGIDLVPDLPAARVGTRTVPLGELEFRVLAALVRRPGVVCPHDLLLREAWGHRAPADPTPLKHHLSRLRDKLGPAGACLGTVRSVGYRYDPASAPAAALRHGGSGPPPT